MRTKQRPLEKIDALPKEQQQQLAYWVTTLTLAKSMELAKEHFGEDIPQTTLYRYRKRCVAAQYVDKDEDSAHARAELIAAAASGKPKFSEATVNLLEKHAFELAHAPQEPDAMDALKDLFGLLNSNKAAAVRDRMAKVKEDKVQLRRDELDWKKSSPQKSAARSHSAVSTRNSELKEDHLGPYALDLEGIRRRARAKFRPNSAETPAADELGALAKNLDVVERQDCEKFNLPDHGPLQPAGESTSLPEHSHAPVAASGDNAANIPLAPVNDSSSRGYETHSSLPSVKPKQPLVPSPPSVNSVSSVVESPVSVVRPLVLPEFVEIAPPSPPAEAASPEELDLKRRVDDYTLARHHEFLKGRSETEHVHCPCGHKDLPCPEHGDFSYDFWGAKPDESSYISTLHSKGLPYTSPRHIIEERERAQRKQAGLARLKKEDPDGSKLRERAKLYAIRRFRTFDGPKYGPYIPDDPTWKNQCPCGAELPCDAHDGLEAELRYVHPLNSDYQKALIREGIPIFVPAQLVAKPKPKTG